MKGKHKKGNKRKGYLLLILFIFCALAYNMSDKKNKNPDPIVTQAPNVAKAQVGTDKKQENQASTSIPTQIPTAVPKQVATATPKQQLTIITNTPSPTRKPTTAPTATPKATTKPTSSITRNTVPPQIANATIQYGDNNDTILQIKKKMQELGYFLAGAELSGNYNSLMAERVMMFQRDYGLPVTGIIDEAFLAALYGASSSLTNNGSVENTNNLTRSAPVSKNMTVYISANCSNYNHVGNDWAKSFSINGKLVYNRANITINAGDVITVSARITEQDKNPDVGSASYTYTVTENDIKNGFNISLQIVVTEGSGRYSGCSCTWKVSFSFQ